MAAPNYSSDLTLITACESGTFVEFTGYGAGTISTVPETDYFIQNTGCVSSTVKTVLNSIGFNNGANVSIGGGNAAFIWVFFGAPNSLDNFANGGLRMLIGGSNTAFKGWKIGGSDYPPNPYGGWKNVAVDPSVANDYVTGTPSSNNQWFGIGAACPTSVPAKGAPFAIDVMRYGRGDLRVYGGDANGYATFAGIAANNDNISNRWGLFQETGGSYLWKGLLTLGYSANIDFRDSNRTIFIDDCPRVNSNFTKLEIRQVGSRVDMTSITFQSLANSSWGTVNKGRWETIDGADVNISQCTFIGMDTFVLIGNTEFLTCTFRDCGQITATNAKLIGSRISGYTGASNTSAVVWNANTNPTGYLDNMVFTRGTTNTHAIEFGTSSPTDITLNGITYSGYNTSNGQVDSALHIRRTTGNVTITIVGGDTPTYKSEGANVTVTSAVSVTLTGLKSNTEVRVFLANTTTEVSGTGAENIDDGDHSFSISSGTAVDISVLSFGYQNLRILNYSTTANASIPVSQVLDRQYLNPVGP